MPSAVLESRPVMPDESEASAIRELDEVFENDEKAAALMVGPSGRQLVIPLSVYRLLTGIVRELARGNAVTVAPLHKELTTQQAADILNVSRPFLVRLLENGDIPFHRAGTHRRVLLRDLLTYREHRGAARRGALTELTQESEDLGLYE
ncbi:MAG: helix-turn-helix domain-containing protein [Chloroflexota bacterium]